jgi:peptidoglycan hydrolase FlgJ
MNFAVVAGSAPLATIGRSASTPDHRKLTDAAQQFEGMLLQEMLKPMREHGFAQQDSDDPSGSDCGGSDTLSSFGTEAMSTAIARGGGLGIAKRIVTQVEAERDQRSHVASQPAPQQIPK